MRLTKLPSVCSCNKKTSSELGVEVNVTYAALEDSSGLGGRSGRDKAQGREKDGDDDSGGTHGVLSMRVWISEVS